MRRLLSFMIVTASLFCLWGCGFVSHPQTTESSTLPSSVQSSVIAPQVAQQPMIAVTLPLINEEKKANDGNVLLKSVYQNLELTVPDQEVADAIIIDYLNRVDTITAGSGNLFEEANSAHSPNTEFVPYLSSLTFKPMRIDQGVLSLFGEYVVYKGSAHPEVNTLSLSYDLTTGTPLNTADILQENAVTQLSQLLLESLDDQKEFLYDGYQDSVGKDLSDCTSWYFSEAGLVFYFSPYEIGPYSSGVITAEIPYEKLTGILSDAYFPAEKDTVSGSLKVMSFALEEMENFTQSTEIVCGDNGNKAVLYTDSLLQNVRVELDAYTVFAAATLTPGDSIIIHGVQDVPVTIRYTSGNEMSAKALSFTKEAIPTLSQ